MHPRGPSLQWPLAKLHHHCSFWPVLFRASAVLSPLSRALLAESCDETEAANFGWKARAARRKNLIAEALSGSSSGGVGFASLSRPSHLCQSLLPTKNIFRFLVRRIATRRLGPELRTPLVASGLGSKSGVLFGLGLEARTSGVKRAPPRGGKRVTEVPHRAAVSTLSAKREPSRRDLVF